MSRVSSVARALGLLGGMLVQLPAFDAGIHADQIRAAFSAVPRAATYASPDNAVNESARVDKYENDEPSQYKHSMIPAGTALSEAQRNNEAYLRYLMDAAVTAAVVIGDPGEAGRQLGRVLHAVQDRKHLWCSCGSASNGPRSADPCSESPQGCTTPGLGHHGLSGCVWHSLDGNFRKNFQIRTDGVRMGFVGALLGEPTDQQLAQSLKESIAVLTDFAARVQAMQTAQGSVR